MNQEEVRGGQAALGRNVFLEGASNGAPSVMFLGNSVTWHGPKDDIGWSGAWGMAASAREKDYAHLLMGRVRARHPRARFVLTQGAVWERALEQCDLAAEFGPALRFPADVIIFTLGANTSEEGLTQPRFRDAMEALLAYLSTEKTRWLLCSNLFGGAKNGAINGAIREVAGRSGSEYIDLGDILLSPENRALGLFGHQGVANHPGDLGMARIAERIWPHLEKALK